MNDQTAANTPSDPTLCAMGCGFFGNPATKGYCSKCWRESLKQEGLDTTCPPARTDDTKKEEKSSDADQIMPDPSQPKKEEKVEPDAETAKEDAAPAAVPKKKGKKKKTYKSLMAGMMTCTDSKKVDKEKEALRKVTGGGTFQKIEKI